MEEQEPQDLNNIEFYLRTLRKKVEHQLKNPFNLNFATYSFEELLNWKNNVLQLDATSRLYGQRVDHLHSGTLHVLGAVVNLELHPAQAHQKQSIQRPPKQIEDESSIFHKCLQNPQKLDGGAVASRHNFLQWRQIMRKRDTLPLLMLNQLSLSTSLSLPLVSSEQPSKLYESIFTQESVYLKMINFPQLNQQKLYIFQEIEHTVQEIETFLLTDGEETKERLRESFVIDSFVEFQFPLASQHKICSFEPLQKESFPQNYLAIEDSCLQLPQNDHNQNIQKDSQSNYSSQTLSLYSIHTQSTVSNKFVKKKVKKSKKPRPKKQDDFIDFEGLNPSRYEIFAFSQNDEERFLQQKDYLHLKFIKYAVPFSVRNRHRGKQSMNRPQLNYLMPQSSKGIDAPFATSDPYSLNQTLQYTSFSGGLSKRSQMKFKEAALPIKELKKKIRLMTGQLSDISFSQIKDNFKDEEPLDIFISVLHIAAEDCLLIKK